MKATIKYKDIENVGYGLHEFYENINSLSLDYYDDILKIAYNENNQEEFIPVDEINEIQINCERELFQIDCADLKKKRIEVYLKNYDTYSKTPIVHRGYVINYTDNSPLSIFMDYRSGYKFMIIVKHNFKELYLIPISRIKSATATTINK